MFTNRLFYLLIMIALLVVTACAPRAVSTPISPTATSEASPTLIPTATLLEGRLIFARFNEAAHSFTGTFVSKTDGSAEDELPVPWTEGGGRWSRSGKEIAVVTLLEDGRVGTAIMSPDGSILRVLSNSDATLNLPCGVWTRDDTRLACFAWDDSDSTRNGIYTVSASDGSDIQRLTTPPAGKYDDPGDFSPTGQFIFHRHTGDEGPGPLMLIEADGGEPRVLYEGPVEDPGHFSPDGSLVVTHSYGNLLVIDLDGQVVHRISIANHVAFGPVWSPDGTRIAFSLTTPGVYAADIYTSLPDGADLQRVTNTPDNEINVDWGGGSD